MKFPFFFYPNGYVNRRKILQYSNRGFGGGRGKSEKRRSGTKGDIGSVNGSENRKRGDEAKGKTETRRNFGKSAARRKFFPRKFCGLKIYPYVCSA